MIQVHLTHRDITKFNKLNLFLNCSAWQCIGNTVSHLAMPSVNMKFNRVTIQQSSTEYYVVLLSLSSALPVLVSDKKLSLMANTASVVCQVLPKHTCSTFPHSLPTRPPPPASVLVCQCSARAVPDVTQAVAHSS